MKIGVSAPKTEFVTGKNVEIKYKSGGRYKGDLVNNKKNGKGEMYWPDGSAYHGDFVNDLRSGHGRQFYRDESTYEGQFVNDKRCGHGIQQFSNGEIYEGDFFQDVRHGSGKYIWPNKCEFLGAFYANKREGYGTSKFTNGNVFQGLYKDDKREGPGILTYSNTTLQDVGLWHGLRLIRISCQLPNSFSLSQFPHYVYSKSEPPVITAADTWNTHSLLSDLSDICDCSNDLFEKIKDIYLEYPDACNVKVNFELFNKVFVQQQYGPIDLQRETKLWNTTPFLEDVQKNILKHSFHQTLINVDDILKYNRHCFQPAGPVENLSEQLLRASAFGKVETVEKILKEDVVHPDVSGKDGNTALINAAAIGNCAIINLLLNHGANVNQLNDEGCSALSVSFVLYYTAENLQKTRLCDKSCHLPMPATYLKENIGSESTSPPVMATADHEYPLTYLQSMSPAQIDITSSMELESLDDFSNSTPLNASSADDVDSGICRSGQVSREKMWSRIPLNQFANQRPGMMGLVFPNASIPPRISLLKSRVKNHEQSNQSIFEMQRGHSYLSPVNVIKRQADTKTSESKMDLPNIQNDGAIKERCSTSSSASFSVQSPYLRQSSSRWNKHCAVNFTNTMNLEKENKGKKTLQTIIQKVHAKDNTEISNKKIVQLISKGFAPGENSELPTTVWPSQSRIMEKLIVLRKTCFQECIEFLLKRGANPNTSNSPWPTLFIAIRVLDVPMVTALLLKGASTNVSLPKEEKGIFPLHLSCSFPGKKGYQITEHLLNSLADPDVRMALDDSYLNYAQLSESQDDSSLDKVNWSLTGRTPLHIACGHDENHEEAAKLVRLLLENRANPNVLCNGVSPLAVAIAYGNIQAVDELLSHGADPSLPLSHGIGSALCMCVLSHIKGQLSAQTTVLLLNKLYKGHANILARIPIGPKKCLGTVVDFAYELFFQDERISRTPAYAQTAREREINKIRKDILSHISSLLRESILELEMNRKRREEMESPSKSKFIYTGVNQEKTKVASKGKSVTFESSHSKQQKSAISQTDSQKSCSLLDFCYECGRSVNVKLTPCTRCNAVAFCRKACKMKAWTSRHRNECVRIKDPKKDHRKELQSSKKTERTRGVKKPRSDKGKSVREEIVNPTENYSFG